MEEELDIQPEAGILSVFSRLNYKVWYAIAEFVDNSSQSFYSNEDELKKNGISKVEIKIDYDFSSHILTIQDDAFGMCKKDFIRAVRLDSKPDFQGGRNEFGMGLKTAASWFGDIWSVESTMLGSNENYYTEVNIPELKQKNKNKVKIIISKTEKLTHGTRIIIKNITKRIAKTTTEKTLNLLRSMYRRDLESGKISIIFNGNQLHFNPYKCLEKSDGTVWKKDLNFSFDFFDERHFVKGFVGILKEGSFAKAGLNLFRRNRVVVGGDLEDLNYKPKKIFGQRQSECSLKLFGELDLDDFPVNQAKDGFVWDDGLEDIFVEELKNNISEYISIAKKTKNQLIDENNFSEEKSMTVQKNSKDFIENMVCDPLPVFSQELMFPQNEEAEFDRYINETNKIEEKEISEPREYKIPLNQFDNYNLKILWEQADSKEWIKINDDEKSSSKVIINVNHPFFKPYVNKLDFQVVLERFVAAYVLSIKLAERDAGSEKKIIPSVITNKLNDFLGKIKD